MNKKSSEIVSLRRDIEHNVKRRIRTPHDFEFLSGVVWERLHENISPTTLKRLWGYIEGADTTRRSTLCLLSRFLGYDDWEAYLQHLSEVSDTESDIFTTSGIRVEDLYVGEVVEVEWLPNRRCRFRYNGGTGFTVVENQNSKLIVGDTFNAACFLVGQPMYLDNLVRNGSDPVSYVAGAKSGLVSARIIDS